MKQITELKWWILYFFHKILFNSILSLIKLDILKKTTKKQMNFKTIKRCIFENYLKHLSLNIYFQLFWNNILI